MVTYSCLASTQHTRDGLIAKGVFNSSPILQYKFVCKLQRKIPNCDKYQKTNKKIIKIVNSQNMIQE